MNWQKQYKAMTELLMLAKWFNPAGVSDARGGESLLISCFEPREKQPQQTRKALVPPDNFDDYKNNE